MSSQLGSGSILRVGTFGDSDMSDKLDFFSPATLKFGGVFFISFVCFRVLGCLFWLLIFVLLLFLFSFVFIRN